MYGLKRMIGAARVLHSENVSELMEAMADDARDAEARRQARMRPQATILAAPAREPEKAAQAGVNEDGRVPCRTAA